MPHFYSPGIKITLEIGFQVANIINTPIIFKIERKLADLLEDKLHLLGIISCHMQNSAWLELSCQASEKFTAKQPVGLMPAFGPGVRTENMHPFQTGVGQMIGRQWPGVNPQ